jgi:hypothetical protein
LLVLCVAGAVVAGVFWPDRERLLAELSVEWRVMRYRLRDLTLTQWLVAGGVAAAALGLLIFLRARAEK